MKAIFLSGAVIALALSFLLPVSWALLWQIPALFAAAALGVVILYWLFLWIASLPIRKNTPYETPSPFYYALLNSGYRFLYGAAGANVRISGLEKLPKDRPFLLVSNHLSNFDNMIQSAALGDRRIAYISKPENFKIPIGGRMIHRCCYLPIDRENLRSSTMTIRRASEMLQSGIINIGVYPEGHRGKGYDLQPFHAGCLNAAVWAKCPIVVSTIAGTENIHRNFPFRRTEVHFDILETIDTEGRRASALAEEIRQTMQEHLNTYKRGSKK